MGYPQVFLCSFYRQNLVMNQTLEVDVLGREALRGTPIIFSFYLLYYLPYDFSFYFWTFYNFLKLIFKK